MTQQWAIWIAFPTLPDEEEAAHGEQTKSGRFGNVGGGYSKLAIAWAWPPSQSVAGGEENMVSIPPAT
jgi:hypothetical protein